ncbi:MAG: hypothetical protein HQL11_06875, partial [Candidatus Omnitrophica bacterium]|nr:hypothetical protein [Candidatus Omnitrophota bacterium]
MKEYPHLRLFESRRSMEARVDVKKAAEALPSADDSAAAFHLGSEGTAEMRARYPEYHRYLGYLEEADRIRPELILNEKERLEAAVLARLTKSTEEAEFLELTRRVEDLGRLVRLEIDPQALERLKRQPEKLFHKSITAFLNRRIMESGRHFEQALFLDEAFDAAIHSALRFYEVAALRDANFVAETLSEMELGGEGEAVLIAGGFHAANLKASFRTKEISYVSMVPRVFYPTDHARYERMLLNQPLPAAAIVTSAPAAVRTGTPGVMRLLSNALDPDRVLVPLVGNLGGAMEAPGEWLQAVTPSEGAPAGSRNADFLRPAPLSGRSVYLSSGIHGEPVHLERLEMIRSQVEAHPEDYLFLIEGGKARSVYPEANAFYDLARANSIPLDDVVYPVNSREVAGVTGERLRDSGVSIEDIYSFWMIQEFQVLFSSKPAGVSFRAIWFEIYRRGEARWGVPQNELRDIFREFNRRCQPDTPRWRQLETLISTTSNDVSNRIGRQLALYWFAKYPTRKKIVAHIGSDHEPIFDHHVLVEASLAPEELEGLMREHEAMLRAVSPQGWRGGLSGSRMNPGEDQEALFEENRMRYLLEDKPVRHESKSSYHVQAFIDVLTLDEKPDLFLDVIDPDKADAMVASQLRGRKVLVIATETDVWDRPAFPNLYQYLTRMGIDVSLVDPQILNEPDKGLFRGVVEKMPFENESFDLVVNCFLFDPLYLLYLHGRISGDSFYQEAASEIQRVMKGGGKFYLIQNSSDNPWMRSALEKSGLKSR